MKKKILYIILSLAAVSLGMFNLVSAKEEQDLFKIASAMEKENISVQEWSLHVRQSFPTKNHDQRMETIKKHPEYDWKISEDQDKWKAEAHFSNSQDVEESIQVLATDNEIFLIYEVKGTSWGNEVKEYIHESIPNKVSDIFHGTVTIFSCIVGGFDDKMDRTLPEKLTNVLLSFEAEELEKVEESSFISVTASSPRFKQSIQGPKGAMNLQVGIREDRLGGKTTLVVGTPIITIEY